jgi:hypothetical protein
MCRITFKKNSIYMTDTGFDLLTVKPSFLAAEHECTEDSSSGRSGGKSEKIFETVMKWFDVKGVHLGNIDIIEKEFSVHKINIIKLRKSSYSEGTSLLERRFHKKILLCT